MKAIKNYYPMQADQRTPRFGTKVTKKQFNAMRRILKDDRIPHRIRRNRDGNTFYFKDEVRLAKAIDIIEAMEWHEQMMAK